LPFLLILLIAAAVVATNVDGQAGTRNGAGDATSTLASSLAPTNDAGQFAASEPSTATSIGVGAAQAAPTVAATSTRPAPTSTTRSTPLTLTPLARSTPDTATRQTTITLPPSGALTSTAVGLPAEPGPEGPIVAAYTTYATYTVQPGDTLNKVATQFGVSGDRIMRTSGLADPNLLLPGQVLSIPRDSGWLYRVQPGDTPDTIALRFGVSIEDLMTASGGAAATLRPGDLVFVPDRGTPAPKR